MVALDLHARVLGGDDDVRRQRVAARVDLDHVSRRQLVGLEHARIDALGVAGERPSLASSPAAVVQSPSAKDAVVDVVGPDGRDDGERGVAGVATGASGRSRDADDVVVGRRPASSGPSRRRCRCRRRRSATVQHDGRVAGVQQLDVDRAACSSRLRQLDGERLVGRQRLAAVGVGDDDVGDGLLGRLGGVAVGAEVDERAVGGGSAANASDGRPRSMAGEWAASAAKVAGGERGQAGRGLITGAKRAAVEAAGGALLVEVAGRRRSTKAGRRRGCGRRGSWRCATPRTCRGRRSARSPPCRSR